MADSAGARNPAGARYDPRMKYVTPLAAILLAGCVSSAPPPPAVEAGSGKPWIGVMGLSATKEIPAAGGKRFPIAIHVGRVFVDGPADAAGIRPGDLIVAAEGVDFAGDEAKLPDRLRAAIAARRPGETLSLTVVRDRVESDIRLDRVPVDPEPRTPGEILRKARPDSRYTVDARRRQDLLNLSVRIGTMRAARKIPADAEIFPDPPEETHESLLARKIARDAGYDAEEKDLVERLAATHLVADFWRLPRMAYAHRNPWRLAGTSQRLIHETTGTASAADRFRAGAAWLDRPLPADARPYLPAPETLTLNQRLSEIETLLGRIRSRWDAAFARLSPDDMTYLEKALDRPDRDWMEFEPERRMLALSEKVDLAALFSAAGTAARFLEETRGAFLTDLAAGLAAEATERIERDTPFGRIVVCGNGDDWHKGDPPAFLVDLGGNDLYTHGAGSSAGRARPASIVLDAGGDDAYQSSDGWSQGCGKLGVGILADIAGDDRYLAQDWGQGAAFLGAGLLLDLAGDDAFRANDCAQGCALWGIGLLCDMDGRDRYAATGFAQACAMPGGFAMLEDAAGDDSYFCKGRHPTGYGDAGLFEAIGQGSGYGFRSVNASGGIALLADLAGDDRYEAGHFSQGGGYYYGWGLLFDRAGDDGYLGSRYAQGFAAHQALGYFEDADGNDRYATLQAVAQGCSWDETAVVFLDRAGNDVYEGGTGFSQGASAHNGFCLFADLSGSDTYRAGGGQGIAGDNSYHGGHSLSVFLDSGDGTDRFSGAREPVPPGAVTRTSPGGVVSDPASPATPEKEPVPEK